MSIKIVKGSYSSVVDSASLSGNQTLTLPNASGTVALTNQFAKVATSGVYNDLSGKPSLAKVATSGSYNDLSNKPSIPSTPQGYITQTWRNGRNWYRVYSDGWLEQGGVATFQANSNATVNLHRSFSSTNYIVIATRTNWDVGNIPFARANTTSNFIGGMTERGSTRAGDANWIAYGY